MKLHLKTFVKPAFLFFSWLIFPPLFLTFSIIWKMPRLVFRIVLTLLAPGTLIFLLLVTIMTVSVNEKFLARGTRKEIETKTGIEYPRYRMIERRHFLNGSLMSSDFTMEYTVKFDPAKNAAFYEQVERQLTRKYANEYGDSLLYWAVNKNGNYVFTQPWSESQETLEIEINKNKPEITIQYGSW